jgi:transposase
LTSSWTSSIALEVWTSKVLLQFGVLLLHDNAWPHTAHTTAKLLTTWHWEILPHYPYSPDLAPSDFYLCPKLKKHLQRLSFQNDEDIQEEVKQWICLQDATFYHQGFDSLIY